MPRKKVPCPECGNLKAAESKLCKDCSQPYKRTTEHKQKMSKKVKRAKARNPRVGWKHSQETRCKIANSWTDEMREDARQRGMMNAENREWLVKIAESLSGENNPNYQGKDQESPYAPGWGRRYRERIRDRANGICEVCGKKSEQTLDLHHKDFGKDNHDPDNLLVVCRPCHKRLHAANSDNT